MYIAYKHFHLWRFNLETSLRSVSKYKTTLHFLETPLVVRVYQGAGKPPGEKKKKPEMLLSTLNISTYTNKILKKLILKNIFSKKSTFRLPDYVM